MFSQSVNLDVAPPAWRERSLERNLSPARTRAVERFERLVTAARDLANETGSAAFTVQQVCARSGVSLKGFYGGFDSKDALLVALIEEDTRIGASVLHEIVDAHTDPEARLHAYVTGLFELLTLAGALGYARMLVREQRRLAETQPVEMRAAIAPLVDMLATEIVAATEAGVIASDDPPRDAQTVFSLLLEGIYDVTRGVGEPLEQAAYVWRFCRHGLDPIQGAPR